MKIRTLSKSEIKKLNSELGISIDKKDNVQMLEDEKKFIRINDVISFFYHADRIVPTIKLLSDKNFLKKITVDMGAIRFLCNGADLMRAGITAIDDGISQGDIVSIIDEQNKRCLMVGIALLGTEDMRKQQSGKSVKSLHYVGDDIWKM